jgi:hypothetical protein
MQTLFTHISPGLHVMVPHMTPPDELAVEVVMVVLVEPELAVVVIVVVDEPPAPPPEVVIPVEVFGPVEVEVLPAFTPPPAALAVEVDVPAPVPLLTDPPHPTWARSAVIASERGTKRADRGNVMTMYLLGGVGERRSFLGKLSQPLDSTKQSALRWGTLDCPSRGRGKGRLARCRTPRSAAQYSKPLPPMNSRRMEVGGTWSG